MRETVQKRNIMSCLRMYSNSLIGKYVMVNAYEMMKGAGMQVPSFEYLYDEEIPAYDYIDRKSRKNIKVVAVSVGEHDVPFNDAIIGVSVCRVSAAGLPAGIMLSRNDIVLHEVVLRIKTPGTDADADVLLQFVDASKKHVEDIMLHHLRNAQGTIKKYIYDTNDSGHWELLNISSTRPVDSIFLPRVAKTDMVSRVKDFVTPATKAEYAKFNVPYKLNVLFHGLPGTGKTSCIHALASEIGSDIGIIHFSRALDDSHFTKAINTLSNLDNCRIVILEDIDCLFSDERKAHDTQRNNVTMSGLLNCLDGMARNEGIILFMTTNDRKVLKDAAFVRACRIDIDVEFKEATPDQVYDMIAYYFPEQAAAQAREALLEPFVGHPGCTTATLQAFFFLHRTCGDIRKLTKAFKKHMAMCADDESCDVEEKRASMYM